MVNISNEIIEKIQLFLHSISASGLHIERALLFGSYTKGTANTWSDIDIAIVSKTLPMMEHCIVGRMNKGLVTEARVQRPDDRGTCDVEGMVGIRNQEG